MTYFSRVDVAAVRVHVGVVREKHGGVDPGLGRDSAAGIARRNDMDIRTVLANQPEAKNLETMAN